LTANQRRLQSNMTINFKKTGNLVRSKVNKLNSTVNQTMMGLSEKMSGLSKKLESLSLSNIMAGIGGGLIKLLNPISMITGTLSMVWKGVWGLTKWAAGGLFSILGKFFKTPAGLFAIGYMIGYAYTKWIKPWWDNIAKTEIGKWMSGEKSFLDAVDGIIRKTLGIKDG